MREKISKVIGGILLLISSNNVSSAYDIAFEKKYDIILPVDGSEVNVGSLIRYEVDIDEKHIAQSHYRSKLKISLDCNKIKDNPLESSIYQILLSSCNSLESVDGFITYISDSYSDGIQFSNAFMYKIPDSVNLESLIPYDFSNLEDVIDSYPPDKGRGWYYYWPLPEQYITLFMSEHHKMRLNAVVSNLILEPGVPCEKPLTKSTEISFTPFKICLSDSECNDPNSKQAKYGCLSPELSYYPQDFDDAIESQEPLFLSNLDSIPSNIRLYLNQYATFFPFYPIVHDKIAPPTAFAYHKKMTIESEGCCSEESSENDPEYSNQRTKIRYCRLASTSKWSEITLFENEKPILIFRH